MWQVVHILSANIVVHTMHMQCTHKRPPKLCYASPYVDCWLTGAGNVIVETGGAVGSLGNVSSAPMRQSSTVLARQLKIL